MALLKNPSKDAIIVMREDNIFERAMYACFGDEFRPYVQYLGTHGYIQKQGSWTKKHMDKFMEYLGEKYRFEEMISGEDQTDIYICKGRKLHLEMNIYHKDPTPYESSNEDD